MCGALAISSLLYAMKLIVHVSAAQLPRSPGSDSSREIRTDWPVYGGAAENTHYSNLTQINRKNVKELKVAWSYDTGEKGGLQTSPIIVADVLYGITPAQKVFAVNAANGKLLWKFDSGMNATQPDRGLAYWSNERDKRILVGVMNFHALNASTGEPIASFGKAGGSIFAASLAQSESNPWP
jgi:quinoprotein glucose dehydrogenase